MKIEPEDMSDFLYERKKEDALILRSAEEVDLDLFLDELNKQEMEARENDEEWEEWLAIEQAKGEQETKKILNNFRVTLDGIIKALGPK